MRIVSGQDIGKLQIEKNKFSEVWIDFQKLCKLWGGFGSNETGELYSILQIWYQKIGKTKYESIMINER